MQYAKIDPNNRLVFAGCWRDVELHGKTGKPCISQTGDGDRHELPHEPESLTHTHPPQLRDTEALALDGALVISNIETVVASFLLEGGVFRFMAKKLAKSSAEMGKRLAMRIAVHLVHPGVALVLDRIPLHLQLRRRRLFTIAVLHLPVRESPVVGKPSGASRLLAEGFLVRSQVEGNLMREDHADGPFNGQAVVLSQLA